MSRTSRAVLALSWSLLAACSDGAFETSGESADDATADATSVETAPPSSDAAPAPDSAPTVADTLAPPSDDARTDGALDVALDTGPIDPVGTVGDGDFVEPPPYELGPDSMEKAGVPKGVVTKYSWTSKVLPNTTRDYWVYVPAQYVAGTKTAVMVLQDGANYVSKTGNFRTTIVLDNLIAKKELPPIVAVFIAPVNRSVEYDSMNDSYSKLVIDEILPEVGKKVTLTDDPERRAIGGHSSGGICAFTVGWHRPDAFRRILTHNGSFVNIRGGDKYPSMVTATEKKPLRVFLLSGKGDLDNQFGSWAEANKKMAAALDAKGYHYRFVFGEGSHTPVHAGANLPETLKWLWRGAL